MTPAEFRTLRKSLNLTQTALGFAIDMSQRQITDLETGKSPLRGLHIFAIKHLATIMTGKINK